MATETASFGAGKRESHDASAFYRRRLVQHAPNPVSGEPQDPPAEILDTLFCKSSETMEEIPDDCVALMVTSPPYNVGKEYDDDLTLNDYLDLLHRVLKETYRVLEPGGRVAVNVANLGRKPYRSLSADVISILQDDLGMLLRGEVIWQKAKGATGSCAWGSYLSPQNPVLRDLTERVVIASKGRFDRALSRSQREKLGLPHQATIAAEEFLQATLDVWEIPSESATRVGHPAPFPKALPRRLIELYTYQEDLVLDPFMGSGTTAIAAVETGRHYVGFDTEPSYVELAECRIGEARLS